MRRVDRHGTPFASCLPRLGAACSTEVFLYMFFALITLAGVVRRPRTIFLSLVRENFERSCLRKALGPDPCTVESQPTILFLSFMREFIIFLCAHAQLDPPCGGGIFPVEMPVSSNVFFTCVFSLARV